MRFVNEASNNTVQYLTLQGVNTNGIGVVTFGSTNGANGNDNNLIDHCDIGDGASKPAVGILSTGNTTSTAKFNSNNIVSNCHFFNFSSATAIIVSGITLYDGNTDWTIYGNSFYGSLGGGSGLRVIYINAPNGNNFNVTHNFFGGTAASASGTSVGYTTPSFTAIYLNVGTSVPSIVQGTTLQLIGVSASTNLTSLPGACCGIFVQAGSVDIKNNNIGLSFNSPTFGTVNLFSVSAPSGAAYGIGSTSQSTLNILNNAVGGISISTGTVSFTGIEADGGSGTISGNVVGSTVFPNSINASGGSVTGINASFSTGVVISNNTVANFNQSFSGTGTTITRGISTTGGVNTISGNTVHHLSTNSTAGFSVEGNLSGISMLQSAATQTISHNLVYALSDTATTTSVPVGVSGIYHMGTTGGNDLLNGNFVHSLSVSSTNVSSFISGMTFTAGACTVQNNMVRVGLDESGASTGNSGKVWGINDNSGNTGVPSFYHNSVYVGGTQVSGASPSFAFQSSAFTSSRSYQNNVFANARSRGGTATGKNYAVAYGGSGSSPAGLTADNNLFFVSGAGGVLGTYSGDKADLASWQAATGVDANSIVGDPLYNNPTGTSSTVDLHLQVGSPAHHAGVPISGITTDIESDPRSATTPDIGADELGQPEIVVEQPSGTGLLDGASTVDYGNVSVGGTAAIKIFNIRSVGTASLTGLSFAIDGAAAGDYGVSSASSTPLAPNDTEFITVTFLPSATGFRRATLHIMSNDFDESSFDVALSGIGVTGIATYQQWAQTNGVSSDPSVRGPNGQSNLLNFGFGISPSVAGTGSLQYTGTLAGSGTIASTGTPITRQEGTDLRALFVRRKDYATVGLTYTVQFSAGLSSWQDSTDTPTVLADDGTNQIVSVPYPAGLTASGFFRISVTLP